ncbi:hypothetical protein GCM10010178_24860 [Lentzea flava]|uniref:Uncharacterized protein n=1 Tax=Lentzea flava TaxID=103732 RepID=A0ABQ2UIM4_9PSEU|nr:hypothetical protein GCM10010178_24860 [Lentzea flava]
MVGVRVIEAFEVPAAVGGEPGDGVDLVDHELPQLFRRRDTAGIAAGHADDHDRVVRSGHRRGQIRRLRDAAEQLGAQVGGQGSGGRVVEDQRRGQADAGRGGEAVAQFDGGQRVEAEVAELLRRVDRVRAAVAEDASDLGAHDVEQRLQPVGLRQRREPRDERDRGVGARHGTLRARPHQAAQHRCHLALRPQHGEVEPERRERGAAVGDGRVEQLDALLHRDRGQAGAAHAFDVHFGQMPGHAAFPGAPGQRHGVRPMLGERVEERVGGRVAALSRAAERAGDGREQHEPIELARQLVQVPGGVDLGPQDVRHALGRQRLDHAVVQHTGGVHDRADRVLRQQFPHRFAVRDVAPGDGDARVQLVGPLRLLTAPADQHQLVNALSDEVFRDDTAQSAGAAGDQHRALPRDLAPRAGRPLEPRGLHHAVTDDQLGLVDAQRAWHELAGVGVDDAETAGVLGLRRPHEPPHRRARQAAHAGDEHQLLLPLFGDPLLQPRQRLGDKGVRRLDDLALGDDVLHHDAVRRFGGHLDLDPVELEQRVAVHGGELLGGHRPHRQRVHRRHRRSRGVRQRDRDAAAVAGQLHPQRRRTGRVQRDAFPGERQPGAVVDEQRGVQRRVEQRGVQPEPAGRHAVGQRDLGEHGVAVPPRGPQPLERGPVLEPVLGEPLVGVRDIDGLRARRPLTDLGDSPIGPEHTRGVLGPRLVHRRLWPGVDGDRPAAALLGSDDHLDLDATRLGQHQRCRERQLLDAVQSDLVRRPQRQLDESRARHEHRAVDGVVGEPRPARQPRGEQVARSPGQFDRGTEHRVLHRAQASRPDVRLRGGLRPERLVVERVGRHVDPSTALVEPRPVNIDAVNMYLTECSQH